MGLARRSLALGIVAAGVALAGLLPGEARSDVDLWPLLRTSDEETTVLYPFYVREERFLMVFPFYYRTGEDRHVLWPLFKASEGSTVRVAPVYFRGENRYTLFPLIHRGPDYTFWSAPPSLFKRDGSFRGVFPLFARSEHRLFVMPGYYRSRAPGQPERDVLFPFFARWKGADGAGVLTPLYLRQDSRDTQRKWFMPFWMTTKKSWSDGTQDSWLAVLWPVFERKETRAPDGELQARRRRFLIFTDEVDAKGARTLGLLWVPVFERL